MINQKNVQDQEEQQPLIDSSPNQDITSLKSQLVANNDSDKHGLIYRLWLIPFNCIKKKWLMYILFAFTLYLSCCGYNNCSSAEGSKVSLFVHSSHCFRYFYSHAIIIKKKDVLIIYIYIYI